MVTLSGLVSDLDAELVRQGYKASTMVWYRGCWRRLERFFVRRSIRAGGSSPRVRGSPRYAASTGSPSSGRGPR